MKKRRNRRGRWEDSSQLLIFSEQFTVVDFFVFRNTHRFHVDLIMFNQCHLEDIINEDNILQEKGIVNK